MPDSLVQDGDTQSTDSKTGIITLKPKSGIIYCDSEVQMNQKRQAFEDGGYHVLPFSVKDGKKDFEGFKATKSLSPTSLREVTFGLISET